ncbi:hypothetical protein [Verminephrobacter eiseniae]|uniref:hypothetical protein n=1 Tax=Verminephrobacter eiseniae TaxID=364317 RepID=UPI002238C5DA|nr:hypothetical protein [Verminephrobacter eiseniae]MCW5232685.1 hypothetical protein [Verminephrobacter eiseniae]MCW5295751.1 hypothetical protein [Verminephrobacter eiseniae]MCW8184588.1 hypothetical protein [Verminephrobacter eiseniae]MCW8223264.1 hypothetical protein [Verminephrobacter eiseniae]MCW8232441.1 hypothetical protein [Verminephrobacter eiseniae]
MQAHSARRRNGHSRATPDGPLPTAQEEPVLAGDRAAGHSPMAWRCAPARQVHGRPGKSVIPPPPWLLRAANGRA